MNRYMLIAALVFGPIVSLAVPHAHADVLVSSWGNGRVLRYDNTGNFIDTFVTPGSGGLVRPYQLAFGPDQNLYVGSDGSSNVLRYDGATGEFVGPFASGGGLGTVRGSIFGPDGSLYVSSPSGNNILRFDGPTGAWMDVFATGGGLSYPLGLTFGPDGNLYVSNGHGASVLRYNGVTGDFMDAFVPIGSGGLNNPEGLAFGPDGSLYVASVGTNSVLRYDGATGSFMGDFVPSGTLRTPYGLVFGPDGNLYVSSAGTNSILRFDGTTGSFLDVFIPPGSGGLSTPTLLTFTPVSNPLPGDYNQNGTVDAADYVVWRKNGGPPTDYNTWRANFGTVSPGIGAGSGAALPSAEPLSAAVPEPATFALAVMGILGLVACARRRHISFARTIQNATAWSVLTTVVALSATGDPAQADTFGSGANTFDITFVTIGNPGNAADTTGAPNPAGSVAEAYRIGKYEISEQMIDKANALGGVGITKNTSSADKPATSVSWNEAAQFINWLNTSTGSTPAYKFAIQPGEGGYSANADIQLWLPSDAGYDPNNLYRNSLARYFLPSVDEWYKAAYYDPTSGVYYDYPTGSDSAPTAVASGTLAGTAVYGQPFATGPANITLAGGLSPFGTMGQGGNSYEWEETDSDLVNGPTPSSSTRGCRGGFWGFNFGSEFLSSSSRAGEYPTRESDIIGFRVASIPGLSGDFNNNGIVDAADYTVYRNTLGQAGTGLAADGNGNGSIDIGDYSVWRAHFGQTAGSGSGASANAAVPEPMTMVLLIFAAAGWCPRRRRAA